MQRLIDHVRRVAVPPDGSATSDGQLLECYLARRDTQAFEALVRRHGPMVLGVCRRITGHAQDAEDAFQAVFLVLAHKGDSIHPREKVGNWLYGVACRSALESRTRAQRQRCRERPLLDLPVAAAPIPSSADHGELCAILDDELRQLPEKLRAAVVLCELEGRSRHEAAQQLGVPEGTLSSRLAAARRRLAARLRQRGMALPAGGLLALALPGGASASLPAPLLAQLLHTTAQYSASQSLAVSGASATILALAEGIMKSMFLNRLKSFVILAAVCLLGLAVASTPLWSALSQTNEAKNVDQPVGAVQPATDQPASTPKPARIYVARDGGFASVLPDGADWNVVLPAPKKEMLLPMALAVSPDSKQMAYLKMTEKAIAEAKKRGDRPDLRFTVFLKTLGANFPDKDLGVTGAYLRWTPDGKQLLVVDPPTLDATVAKPTDAITFWLVRTDTGAKKALKLPDGHFPVDFSPDGAWVLTNQRNEKGKGPILARVSMDGSKVEPLTEPKQRAAFGRFSPDGKHIAFLMFKNPKDKGPVLAVRDVASPNAEPTVVSVLNGEIEGFCWSPDGKRIAYTWRERQPGDEDPTRQIETEFHLVVVDRDGSNLVNLHSQKGPSQYSRTLGYLEWR